MHASQLHLHRSVAVEAPQRTHRCQWAFGSGPACRQHWRRSAVTQAAKQESEQEEDESRYPEKNLFTGGWAGGEKGVQKFVEEFANEPTPSQKREIKKAAKKDPNVVSVSYQGKKVVARKIAQDGSGSDPIYIGMKKGASADDDNTTFIVDDARKYAGKEDLGPLSGVVGGFAGGERGVQQFIQEGEVKIAEKGRKQQSPLLFAGLVAVVGTVGALLLTKTEEVGEELVGDLERGAASAGSSGSAGGLTLAASLKRSVTGVSGLSGEQTKLLLEVGLGGLTVFAVLYFGQKAVRSFATSAREGAINVAKLVAFGGVVLVAAKYVIEN